MAELPDLTVFSRILSRKFKGEVLDKLEVTVSKKLNVTAVELADALGGHELQEVKREGKTLQFHFSGGQVLGLHLMLCGELVELENGEISRLIPFLLINIMEIQLQQIQIDSATLKPDFSEIKNLVKELHAVQVGKLFEQVEAKQMAKPLRKKQKKVLEEKQFQIEIQALRKNAHRKILNGL